jgi:hypothetical protein
MLKGYRKTDRASGLGPTDLSYDIIEDLIRNPCFYCDETEITMTLDRIDNTIGHIRSNVVPACFRCNMLRGSMPYAAWLVVSKAVKEARLLGLFGSWAGPSSSKLRKRA